MRTITLYSWETRRYLSTIITAADPSVDEFEVGVVEHDAADQDPAAWAAGAWSGTWNAATERIDALTPTFGTSESTVSPDVTLTEGTTYRVFGRVRNASDAPGDLIAVLRVE